MKKGDRVRNKLRPHETAYVLEVENKYIPGYGMGRRIFILQGGGNRWVPTNQWEVIR